MPKKKQLPAVQYKTPETRFAATALPFYQDTGNFWCLPATGEGHGGVDAGRAMADAYLKHLAESDDETPILHYVVLSLRARFVNAEGPELDALHNQSIGFFSEVCKFLRKAMDETPDLAAPYRKMQQRSITKRANEGLQYRYRST